MAEEKITIIEPITALPVDTEAITGWAVTVQEWVMRHVLHVDTAIQVILIVAAYLLGLLLARMTASLVTRMAESMKLPSFIRLLLLKTRRLLMPLFMLGLLFLSLAVISAAKADIDIALIDTSMRLVSAWVIIRIAVQIVHNPYLRNLLMAIVLTIATLSIFGILDDTARVLDALGFNLGKFRLSALTVVKSLFAISLMAYASLALSQAIDRKIYSMTSMSMASRLLIAKLSRISLMILAVLMGITLAGVDLSLLTVFSGAVGLGIGFGLQRGVGNLFTGMMLLLDKTIQPGDVVELANGSFGTVRQMGARYTEIMTPENKSHLVPNESLVTNTVINWSRNGGHILVGVDFRTEYDNDPRGIMSDAIQAALSASPRVLRDPPPACNFNKFGDLGLEYTLQFWIADPHNGTANVRSEVLLAIWEQFRSRDVTLPNLNHSTFGGPKKEDPPAPPAPVSEQG